MKSLVLYRVEMAAGLRRHGGSMWAAERLQVHMRTRQEPWTPLVAVALCAPVLAVVFYVVVALAGLRLAWWQPVLIGFFLLHLVEFLWNRWERWRVGRWHRARDLGASGPSGPGGSFGH